MLQKVLVLQVFGFTVQKKNLTPPLENPSFKKLGITDEYEGIGHCALGYAMEPVKDAAPRKENYVYYI
jgi:hypothetical protein